jgi:hypothetical protein
MNSIMLETVEEPDLETDKVGNFKAPSICTRLKDRWR